MEAMQDLQIGRRPGKSHAIFQIQTELYTLVHRVVALFVPKRVMRVTTCLKNAFLISFAVVGQEV
jgi:hypothetical protein